MLKHFSGASCFDRSTGACRPPAVHAVSFRAASKTHLRVSASPHDAADFANTSQAENARMVGRVTLAFGAYFLNRSRSCWDAGFVEAFSKGKTPLTSARLF